MNRYYAMFITVFMICSFTNAISSESSQPVEANSIQSSQSQIVCSHCDKLYRYGEYRHVAHRSIKNILRPPQSRDKEPSSATCVRCGASITMKWVAKQKSSE